MNKWPFPGDSPMARARKMALAYRALAMEQAELIKSYEELVGRVCPDAKAETDCWNRPDQTAEQLDTRFADWGQTWHAEIPINYGPDDMIKAKYAAPLINLNPHSLGRLRQRGRIKAKWVRSAGETGHYLYKVSDVYELSTKLRGRGWRADDGTDRVAPDGGSDSE